MLQARPDVKRSAQTAEQTFSLQQFVDAEHMNDENLRLPAQQEILDCAHKAVTQSAAEAFAEESRAVGRLITMSQTKTLIQQFFASR
jgi:hypothetical protein